MDSDHGDDRPAFIKAVQTVCLILILLSVAIMFLVSSFYIAADPQNPSRFILAALWSVILGSIFVAAALPLIINLRFSLQSLMLFAVGVATSVTLIISGNTAFKTIGVLGLIFCLLVVVGAISRSQMHKIATDDE
jgi:hypothetical protein